MSWARRIANVLAPGRHAREIAREMEFHLAERRAELIAAGLDPDSAAQEAERRFGNRLLQADRTRDAGVLLWLESLVADLRYALRGFRRDPVFAAVAILSLAFGIGANTALFSLTNALLLRSLPVRAPEELVRITRGESTQGYFTNPIWEAIRDRQKVFTGAFAYADQRFNLAESGPARRVRGALVGGGFFETLGVRPAAGRLLAPGDDVRGCPPVAVVSGGFAARELGGAAAAVGRSVPLDGRAFRVVGVADPAFHGIEIGAPADVYAPLCALTLLRGDPEVLDHRSMWYLRILGRLAPGVSLARARSELAAIAPAVHAATVPAHWNADDQSEYLESELGAAPAARGLSELRDQYGQALVILLGIVALVLLVACANIANLLLARAAARQGECAVRRALGAGRARIVRQMLTESLLLSLAGAALGVAFAHWASRLLVGFVTTSELEPWLDLSPDARVIGFVVAAAAVTGLLFGLAPARYAARAMPVAAVRRGRDAAGVGAQHRAGRVLVVGQVALSLVLVSAAALLVGSFRRLSTLDPGFRAPGILVVAADFEGTGLAGEAIGPVRLELLERLRALPQVEAASASQLTPLGNMRWNEEIVVPGYTAATPMDGVAWFNAVSDGYFSTLGMRLVAGRDLAPTDRTGTTPVGVVSEAFVARFFGGEPALGRSFGVRQPGGAVESVEIVGIVGDAKYSSLDETPAPTVYRPLAQLPGFGTVFAFEVRSSAPAAALTPAVRRAVAETSPAISYELTQLSEQLDRTLVRPRLLATLSGFFGALALLLAMIGLYGTLAQAVTRRRGEIGLRMALGAPGGRVLRMIVSDASRLVVVGLVVGLGLTLAGTRWLTSFLYGVTASDPASLGTAAALLAATALCAALVPALRATRVQPAEILRE